MICFELLIIISELSHSGISNSSVDSNDGRTDDDDDSLSSCNNLCFALSRFGVSLPFPSINSRRRCECDGSSSSTSDIQSRDNHARQVTTVSRPINLFVFCIALLLLYES